MPHGGREACVGTPHCPLHSSRTSTTRVSWPSTSCVCRRAGLGRARACIGLVNRKYHPLTSYRSTRQFTTQPNLLAFRRHASLPACPFATPDRTASHISARVAHRLRRLHPSAGNPHTRFAERDEETSSRWRLGPAGQWRQPSATASHPRPRQARLSTTLRTLKLPDGSHAPMLPSRPCAKHVIITTGCSTAFQRLFKLVEEPPWNIPSYGQWLRFVSPPVTCLERLARPSPDSRHSGLPPDT